MTQEKLNECNNNRAEYEWCEDVRRHYLNRMSLRFDTTKNCIENYDYLRCPEWLKDMIFEAVKQRQEELEEEFKKL